MMERFFPNTSSHDNAPFAHAVYKSLKPKGASDFHSPKGRAFVNSLNILKAQLEVLNIHVDSMSPKELKRLASQLTEAIQHEISNQKNWLDESVVTGEDIANAAIRLASAVDQIRAGVYTSGPQTVTLMPMGI